jgi:hypothetical protein
LANPFYKEQNVCNRLRGAQCTSKESKKAPPPLPPRPERKPEPEPPGRSAQAESLAVAHSHPRVPTSEREPVSLSAPTIRGDVYIHTYIFCTECIYITTV